MMSFTNPELKARIDALKLRYDHLETSVNFKDAVRRNADEDTEARYFSARMAVITNLLRTMKNSVDQISVCFSVSKFMFFYQEEIVRNPSFWREEEWVNSLLLSHNVDMSLEDRAELERRFDVETQLLSALQGADQNRLHLAIHLLNEYQEIVGEFHEQSANMVEMEGRQKKAVPLYDTDQKPKLGATFTAEAHLKDLNLRSSRNADLGMVLNADLAESCVLAFEAACASEIGLEAILPDIKLLKAVMKRFDVLEDSRDNRYGFTQIRFG